VRSSSNNSQRKAQEYISRLCKLFIVLDTTSTDIEGALAADITDFEDAVMIETAKREGMDAIVTRDIKYTNTKDRIKVYSASDLIGLI
jgi:predicted nucleic acid-binding protein